jgi:hypothetical protein
VESYITLTEPAGGWTWEKVQKLETRIYETSDDSVYEAEIYEEGDAGGTALYTDDWLGIGALPSKLEIEVISELLLSTSDSISITENVTRQLEILLSTSDAVSIVENTTTQFESILSAEDLLSITESINPTQIFNADSEVFGYVQGVKLIG